MRYTYIILLAAGFSLSIQAQTVKQDTIGLNRVLNLEREYNPTLQDASKISQLPEIKEPEAPKSKVDFSNYTLPYTIAPYINLINPTAYLTDLATSKNRGYVNLGLSTLFNINGDVGYQLVNTEDDYLSVFASHRSSNSKANYLQKDSYAHKDQKMKINDNLIGIDYKHNFEKVKLFTDAQYTYSGFNYYGAPTSPFFPDDVSAINPQSAPTQVNHLFGIHAGVESVNNKEIEYKINVGYRLFKQDKWLAQENDSKKENRIMADVDLHAYFNPVVGIGVGGYLKNYSYNIKSVWGNKENNPNYTTISLNPYFTFEKDNWQARVGLTVNGQFGGVKETILAPDARFDWRPFRNHLHIYLLAGGGIQENSSYSMFYENRYVDPSSRVKDSYSPLDGTLGVEYLVIPNLSMEAFAGFKITKDEHFFFPMSKIFVLDDNLFSADQHLLPGYLKTETVKIGGAIKYLYQELFDFRLKATYYKWMYSKGEKDYLKFEWGQKPTFVTDLSIGIKPIPQLRFDLLYHFETGRKTATYTIYYETSTPNIGYLGPIKEAGPYVFESTQKMKDIHDLSLTGTYTINKTISVYLTVDNLLFQKYDIWYGYPAQNFNIMGGINVKF
jgi:hypothetical protein